MLFVSNRNVTLRTVIGHVIHFEAGVPMEVPAEVRRQAMAIGVIPADGQAQTIEDVEAEASRIIPITGSFRDALIFAAMKRLRTENITSTFDASGRPTVAAVNAHFHGFLVLSSNDRNNYWDELRALISGNEDIPADPKAATFFEIAAVNSRDEMLDLGKTLGVSASALGALSVRDGRRALMNALLKKA